MIHISEKQYVPSLDRLSFCPGEGQRSLLESVSVAGAVYSLGILEQGVMFPFLSAAAVEGSKISERWRLTASVNFSKV